MNEGFPGHGESHNGAEQLSEVELFNKAALAYEENFDRIVRRLIGEETASNAIWKKELGDDALASVVDDLDLLGSYLDREYDITAEDSDIAAFDQAVDDVENALARAPNQYEHDGFRIKNAHFYKDIGGTVKLGRQLIVNNGYRQSIMLMPKSGSIKLYKNSVPMLEEDFENILQPDIPDVNPAEVIEGVNHTVTSMQAWLTLDDEQLRRQIEG